MLKIENLYKTFEKYEVLSGLNLHVEEGSIYGFVGKNGAGKTTTMKILMGLLKADSGKIELCGKDIKHDFKWMRQQIGYVPDHFGVYDNLKLFEYMDFFASCYGLSGRVARKRNEMLIEQVGLYDKREIFVDSLSRGMQQRLGMARALIHNPNILILDEPTSGLDPKTRIEFRQMIKELNEQGKTILISSHLLSDLSELCTHIGLINNGQMILESNISLIMDKINASKKLVVSIMSNRDQALQILREHTLVQTLMIKGNQITLDFIGDMQSESELLQQLVNAGVGIYGFSREKDGLEAMFMQLTEEGEEKVVLSYDNSESYF